MADNPFDFENDQSAASGSTGDSANGYRQLRKKDMGEQNRIWGAVIGALVGVFLIFAMIGLLIFAHLKDGKPLSAIPPIEQMPSNLAFALIGTSIALIAAGASLGAKFVADWQQRNRPR